MVIRQLCHFQGTDRLVGNRVDYLKISFFLVYLWKFLNEVISGSGSVEVGFFKVGGVKPLEVY